MRPKRHIVKQPDSGYSLSMEELERRRHRRFTCSVLVSRVCFLDCLCCRRIPLDHRRQVIVSTEEKP